MKHLSLLGYALTLGIASWSDLQAMESKPAKPTIRTYPVRKNVTPPNTLKLDGAAGGTAVAAAKKSTLGFKLRTTASSASRTLRKAVSHAGNSAVNKLAGAGPTSRVPAQRARRR